MANKGGQGRQHQTGDPPAGSSSDPISAELERALFKRFWTWLAVVGSVVIVVVSGFSVLVSQAVSYAVSQKIDVALGRLADLEKRALESAFATAGSQARSAVAAKAAVEQSEEGQKSLALLSNSIKAANTAILVDSVQSIAGALASDPAFGQVVHHKLVERLRLDTQSVTEKDKVSPNVRCPEGYKVVACTSIAIPNGHVSCTTEVKDLGRECRPVGCAAPGTPGWEQYSTTAICAKVTGL